MKKFEGCNSFDCNRLCGLTVFPGICWVDSADYNILCCYGARIPNLLVDFSLRETKFIGSNKVTINHRQGVAVSNTYLS